MSDEFKESVLKYCFRIIEQAEIAASVDANSGKMYLFL